MKSFRKETRYCCKLKCMVEPTTQVDGIACKKCGSFSYCRCLCRTFQRYLEAKRDCRRDEENTILLAIMNNNIGSLNHPMQRYCARSIQIMLKTLPANLDDEEEEDL